MIAYSLILSNNLLFTIIHII
ncbi:protein of unknown function [Methylocaldum szegediense]|uniref:Uncharacterized protein n=1 Tax=Methylocaldum szegediense TaxID=73780 RepID=A0ABM9I7K7_9GAMM|nr:protein of unknown function [Methylocaldum szegediense]